MTEDEAKTKWCPFVRQSTTVSATYNRTDSGGAPKSCLCIAGDCMAWRWLADYTPNAKGQMRKIQTAYGYCGLAGKP